MITRKRYEELVKKYQNDIPIVFAVVSQNVDCGGYPEKMANDWFVLGYGRLEYPYVYTTIGKIPLYRCHIDKNRAEEEADMRNEVANTYLKEIEEKEKK